MISVEVGHDGPIFDGRADAAARELVHDVIYAVTAQTKSEVSTNLNRSIKHPTPYYETQITMEVRGPVGRVHDRDVVYGPWLEGTSSRNKTTRFKGYASFRRAAQTVQAKVPQLVEGPVRRAVERMGG